MEASRNIDECRRRGALEDFDNPLAFRSTEACHKVCKADEPFWVYGNAAIGRKTFSDLGRLIFPTVSGVG